MSMQRSQTHCSSQRYLAVYFNPFTLRGALKTIVCYSHTFENNVGIKWIFTNNLKESCCLASNQHFSFKCFFKICLCKLYIFKIVRPVLAALSANELTLPMLSQLPCKEQWLEDFWKSSKPCHVGIHWKALAEYFQMSTHLPGFRSFLRVFTLLCIGWISHQHPKG